jgi:hypothetical protein
MRMPLVTRTYAELLLQELERERALHTQTRDELARQREVNERILEAALLAKGIPSPYQAARQGPPPRPIGRSSARTILMNIERSERENARKNETHGTDAADDAAAATA